MPATPPRLPDSTNSMLKSLAQERDATAARLKKIADNHVSAKTMSPATASSLGAAVTTGKSKKKRKKKKKAKKQIRKEMPSTKASSEKESNSAVTDNLDDMAFLDAMVAQNRAAAKKKNAPKNWVKEEAQRWRINQDGILSGKQRSALSARERSDKAKLLRNKIAASQSARGTVAARQKNAKKKTGAKKKKKK